MTNEEKQEIVNEVLAALHTHGKTIDQLTPVTSPSDSDTFELSGGRNLSYGKLKELITAIFTAALNGYVPADALWEYIQQYVAKLGDNGALDWQESPVVMLATMGTTLDNVDGELPAYTLQEGDMYYQYGVNYQIFRKLSDHEEGLPAKTGVVYFNLRTWRTYQWTGSTMVEIAKPKKRVVLADLHTQAYPSMEVGTIAYNPIAKKIVEKVSSTSWSLSDPDPDCIYCDAQTGTSIRWDTTSSTWLSIGGVADIVNNLVEGGVDKALSAEQGCELRYKIEEVYQRVKNMYSLFGNIAFWDGKPAIGTVLPDLNWNVPKQTVTLSLNLTHAVVKHNGTEKSNGSTIQAEQGSTLILTVEPASGYALTTVASSTTGATVSDNGNGTYSVSIVVGSSSMTLSINASADEIQHTITYNLTNCSATTKPTSVAQGGTATIVLQADSNYKMPSSLPSGAVTGASVTSYTVDANDNTKATLVIGNVSGNVSIVVEATSMVMMTKGMFYVVQIASGSNPNLFGLSTLDVYTYCDKRACLYMNRSDVANPCTFNTTGTPYPEIIDHDAEAVYTAIPIPSGATKISIKCNADYYYFPGLADANATVLNTNTQWFIGSTKTEFNLSDYPTATHFAVSFKIGNAGTTAFSNETYESMGIELTFE